MPTNLETGIALNPIQITDGFGIDPSNSVWLLGGWEQNPDKARDLQIHLLENGIASAAFSAFDVMDPLVDPAKLDLGARVQELVNQDELLANLPPRMIMRALLLGELTQRTIMASQTKQPANWVATHCAGANVALVEKYLKLQLREPSALPANMLLLEPMIAEGRKPRAVASETAKQARLNDPRYISLLDLRHADAIMLGMDGVQPSGDILNSRGVTLLERTAHLLNVQLVFGENDVAAPADLTTEQIRERGLDLPVHYYPQNKGNERYGHGFAFDQPVISASLIKEHISAS